MKKNTPKKSFGGSELKFNQVKILNQTIKITLMTSLIVLLKIHLSLVMKNHLT